ncbi:50S ribosomal protein L10 [Candidatus Peribacteria bacterium]|nr:50S ribosomal protein L10 [Candidatus Peribacteria bacterium]
MAEGKPLRGIQHRSPGSGLMNRAVCLAGLPDKRRETFLYRTFALRPTPYSSSYPLPSMALTKEQKQAQLTELKDKMKRSQSVIFAHYIGLTVADVSDLRNKLRENKAEMKVAKKTLMRIAAKEIGLPEVGEDLMDGPVACIFSFEDPLTGAQVAFKFAKDHNQVALIGGIFDGKMLSKDEAVAMAKMPGRKELLGMFMGMVQSPLRSFASICNSPLTGFARALSEVAKKKSA